MYSFDRSKKTCAGVVAILFLLLVASPALAFDREFENFGRGDSASDNTDTAVGIELRGLFNSFPFSLNSIHLDAVTVDPAPIITEYPALNNRSGVPGESGKNNSIRRLPIFTIHFKSSNNADPVLP